MAQQGFEYEKNVSKRLKKIGLVDSNFEPVGAAHDRADLEIYWKKQTINVELKTEGASGGSLALQWDGNKPKGKRWHFSDVSKDDEKQFLANLAESSGALSDLNKKWDKVPAKFARENLPQQVYMSPMIKKYFYQNHESHYTLDDYVILAKK